MVDVKNGTTFQNSNQVLINYFTNITEPIDIQVKVENSKPDGKDDTKPNDNEGLGAGYIALIVVGSIVVLAIIILVVYLIISKKNQVSSSDVEDKA